MAGCVVWEQKYSGCLICVSVGGLRAPNFSQMSKTVMGRTGHPRFPGAEGGGGGLLTQPFNKPHAPHTQSSGHPLLGSKHVYLISE